MSRRGITVVRGFISEVAEELATDRQNGLRLEYLGDRADENAEESEAAEYLASHDSSEDAAGPTHEDHDDWDIFRGALQRALDEPTAFLLRHTVAGVLDEEEGGDGTTEPMTS